MSPPGDIAAFVFLLIFVSPYALLFWFCVRSLRILKSQFPQRAQFRRLFIQATAFAISWSILALVANWAHANLTSYIRSLLQRDTLGDTLAFVETDDSPWLILLNYVGIVPEFPMWAAYSVSLLLSWGNSTPGVIYVMATFLSAVLGLLAINLVEWLLLRKGAQLTINT